MGLRARTVRYGLEGRRSWALGREHNDTLFDAWRFTFVPKRFGTCAPESAELVTHVLLPSGSSEFVGLYHNRSPGLIRGISVECLFAHFAWSLSTDEHIPFFPVGSRIHRTLVGQGQRRG